MVPGGAATWLSRTKPCVAFTTFNTGSTDLIDELCAPNCVEDEECLGVTSDTAGMMEQLGRRSPVELSRRTHVGDCVPKRFMRVIACAFILLYAAQATASGDRGFLPLTNFERTRLVELPAGP